LLSRPKRSRNEAVAPYEEKEEEESYNVTYLHGFQTLPFIA
jgi:hypothetical protein